MNKIIAVLAALTIAACALAPYEASVEQNVCQVQDQGIYCGGPFPAQLQATWTWAYGNLNVVEKVTGGCAAVSNTHTICWATVETPVGDVTVTCDFSVFTGNTCNVD